MSSEWAHKKAWALDEAANFLKNWAGGHFDPGYLAAFLSACPQVLVIRGRDEEGAAPDTVTARKM
jgi:HD-GYP domain-containing protein (c-di-GMP phosphodiesterase class II)